MTLQNMTVNLNDSSTLVEGSSFYNVAELDICLHYRLCLVQKIPDSCRQVKVHVYLKTDIYLDLLVYPVLL